MVPFLKYLPLLFSFFATTWHPQALFVTTTTVGIIGFLENVIDVYFTSFKAVYPRSQTLSLICLSELKRIARTGRVYELVPLRKLIKRQTLSLDFRTKLLIYVWKVISIMVQTEVMYEFFIWSFVRNILFTICEIVWECCRDAYYPGFSE